jgi:hypothetical protein
MNFSIKGAVYLQKEQILLKVPVSGEMALTDVCEKECRKLRYLLYMIEDAFDVGMSDYPDIRKYILDSANFISRFPEMVSEVVRTEWTQDKRG